MSKVQFDEPEPAFHIAYFSNYLDEYLECKTVVRETHYIDRDYIEDFSFYYSKSLRPYDNYCERLHFFDEVITKEDLIRAIGEIKRGEGSRKYCSKLENSYLGFLVKRPIPAAFAGRAVLRPPKKTSTPRLIREFPCLREYKVNLAGIELSLNGLGFQQQDQAVCECATAAIWVALQKVALDFQRPFLAPSEIRNNAIRYRLDNGSGLGLSHAQICEAIRGSGLNPDMQAVKFRPQFCKSLIYDYINSGIPIIAYLGLKSDLSSDDYSYGHAITIVGYAMDMDRDATYTLSDDNSILIRDPGQRITKLYAHDDSIGPYSRLAFEDGPRSTVRFERFCNNQVYYGDIISLIIPLYPKIRLTHDILQSRALLYLKALERTTKENPSSSFSLKDVEVDIVICRGNEYRQYLMKNQWLKEGQLYRLLSELVLPRYVGVARILWGGWYIFDLVMDTTDSQLGDFALALIIRDQALESEASDLSEALGIPVYPRTR